MITPDIFTPVINSYLPEPQASLLNGILFGIPLQSSSTFYRELQMVGLLHVVVLSGMNITILASFISYSTRFFSKQSSILITILIVILFVIFVGIQAPIVRAAIMSILTFVAIIYGRQSNALYLLFLSGLIMIVMKPEWLTSISFQLSFGATLGIILFAKRPSLPKKNDLVTQTIYTLWKDIKPSLAAQVFAAPIIFIYFKQLSIISPLANLLTGFLMVPIMIFGFLTAILGKIHFLLGIVPAYISYGLLSYFIWIVERLSTLPFSFYQF